MQIEIDIKLLCQIREYNKICDAFKIPEDRRDESWVADGILERMRTYLTGYVARRSITERENGAAFQETKPLIQDPEIDDHVDA